MVAHRFEELAVFQRAYKVSLEVHRFPLTMPQIEQYALADQLRRASKSICANLAIRDQRSGIRNQTTSLWPLIPDPRSLIPEILIPDL